MNELIQNYKDALNAIYEHVGLKEDWVVCPIDDQTEMYWKLGSNIIVYAKTLEDLNDGDKGNYYMDDIYRQRFYQKHVYEGEEFTLVFCDPHIDGMKWWRLFDNKKRVE